MKIDFEYKTFYINESYVKRINREETKYMAFH